VHDFLFNQIPEHFPFLLQGALVTVELSLVSMTLALLLGLAVALGRLSHSAWLRWPLNVYVEVWRDTPLIVQLLVIYFTLPEIGISLPGFWAGVLGLTFNLAAYLSEVLRAAINSVDPGQRAAGLSLGMSGAMIQRRIVLPQAFRTALPTIGGYFVALLKDCSLVSFIAVNELLRHATIVISNTFESMDTYFMVAIIYFAMSFTSSRLIAWVERALTPAHRRGGARRLPTTDALPIP
jgi:polar amino acid transport system permease protein